MSQIVLMIGVAGSGKSTYVDKFLRDFNVLCLDDIRLALGDIYSKRTEPVVRMITDVMGRAFMERGLPFVVDSTCTSKYIAEKWIQIAKEYNYKIMGLLIDTPFKTCVERRVGTNKITQEVLDKQSSQLEELLIAVDNKEIVFDSFTVIKP